MESSKHLFFYGAICHICKSNTCREALKRCGGCKLVAYCNTEHQKQHWPSHKNVCKSIRQLVLKNGMNSIFQPANENISATDWCDIRIKCVILVELLLGRKLWSDEWQMFMFPRICEVCKELQTVELVNCEDCLCVSYCSVIHQEEDFENHTLLCKPLKLCREADIYIARNKEPYPHFSTVIQERPSVLPSDMESFITNYVCIKTTTPEESLMDEVLCSECLTCPLTMLYGLQITNFAFTTDNLVVHIAGASQLECGFPLIWELLLHWLPKINTIHVILIGPEVMVAEDYQVCRNCKEKSRKLTLDYYRMYYHSYIESEFFLTPDVIVAYNSGLHEHESADYDPWEKSVPYLRMCKDVPFILTSYTGSESEKDLSRLVGTCKNVNIILQHEKNPFASKRPYRDWESPRLRVFYLNNFVSILKFTS